MALRPELVRTDLIADDRSAARPFYEVIPTPPEHVPASGVLAEASKASPEKGARLVDLIVARLAAAIREGLAPPTRSAVPYRPDRGIRNSARRVTTSAGGSRW